LNEKIYKFRDGIKIGGLYRHFPRYVRNRFGQPPVEDDLDLFEIHRYYQEVFGSSLTHSQWSDICDELEYNFINNLKCTNKDTCEYCAAGFYVFNGDCVACGKDGNSQSMVNGVCVTTHCDKKDRINGTCVKCLDKYTLGNDDYCWFNNSAHCESGSGTLCSTCYDGYEVNSEGKCVECKHDKNYWSENTCKPATAVEHCSEYNKTSDACIYCEDGYILISPVDNEGKVAQQCMPNPHCAASNDHVCTKCKDGYVLNTTSGFCTITNYPCVDSDDNGETCKECAYEHTLVVREGAPKGVCKFNEFCMYTNVKGDIIDKGGKCNKCKNGYYMDEFGECKIIKNCAEPAQADLKNSCTKCDNGYSKVNGVCDLNDNCKTVGSDGVCSECVSGYGLNEIKKCVKIEHCLDEETDNKHSCSKCWDYYESKNGLCVPKCDVGCTACDTSGCTACAEGYYKDTSCPLSTCVSINTTIPHCIKGSRIEQSYGKYTFSCSLCESGYTVVQNDDNYKCVENKQCVRQAEDSGICELCAKGYSLDRYKVCYENNCTNQHGKLDTINYETCIVCDDGYYLRERYPQPDDCHVCPENCTKCDSASECTECSAENSVVDNLCRYNPQCTSKDNATGICLKCNEPYTVVDGFCVKDDGCETAGRRGICLKCKAKYSMIHSTVKSESHSDGVCQYTEECESVDPVSQKCTKCSEGFSVANYDLRLCIENEECEQQDRYGVCNKCKEGHTISYEFRDFNDYYEVPYNYTICEENENCESIDEMGRCNHCKDGYSLNDKYICFENENCVEQDKHGHCSQCKEGSSFAALPYKRNDYYQDAKTVYYNLESYADAYEIFTECVEDKHCTKVVDGFCAECEDDYVLIDDGFNYLIGRNRSICVKDTHCVDKEYHDEKRGIIRHYCVKCEEDYYVDFFHEHICRKDDHCVTTNEEGGWCQECEKDYTISRKNGLCVYNKYCNGRSSEYDKSGMCKSCMSGYHLNKDEAVCENAHCAEGWGSSSCSRCDDGYTWNTAKELCRKNGHCKTIDSDSECTACDSGYTVRSGNKMCMKNPHCNGTSSTGVCASCEFGYKLFTEVDTHGSYEICEAVDHSHCLKTKENDECTECEEGYSIAYVNKTLDGNDDVDYENEYNYDGIVGTGHDVRKEKICVKNEKCVGISKDYECLACEGEVELNTRTGICGSVSTFLLLAVLLVFLL